MCAKIRLVIADHYELFRQGVLRAMETERDLEVVGEADDADHAIRLAGDLLPDIVLVDVSLPSRP